ncbi:ABC transporter permease [Bacillus alkalicellulosilyticus]|uniref:ABC transporter permease n=1 Tax=Alkalihalobacterium alkalicellulosilyticum TaxID=1912214 RepID=UPI00099700E0|nr:ABC transporter permease [Bacillus alkalicellulosilyticus]
MGIWKLAILTLVKRKKMFVLLTAVVSFSILALITLSTTIEGINQSILEKTHMKYGEHHVIVHDITDNDREYISALEEVHTLSEYALVGTTNLNVNKFDSPETLGWLDSSTLDLGKINLIEGRLPTQNNEIAIESFYANRGQEKKKVGSKIDLKVGDTIENFEVVGILSDYSMNWVTPPSVVKGINDFPNIVLYRDDIFKFGEPSYHLMLKYNGSLKEVEESFYSMLGSLDSQENAVNEFLFNSLAKIKTTQVVSLFLQMVLWVTSTVCILFVFNLYYFNYRKKISIFRAYGASNSKIVTIIIVQCFTIVFLSILIAIPLCYFLRNVLMNFVFGEAIVFFSLFKGNIINLVIWLVLTFICILVGAIYSLRLKLSIVENMSFLNQQSINLLKFINKANFPFWLNYLFIQINSSVKQSVLIIFTLSLGTFLMFLGQVLAKEATGVSETNVDFYMNSQTGYLTHQYQGFPIPFSQGPIFDNSALKELEQLHGIEYVDKRPMTDGVSLLVTNNQLQSSIFLKNWVDDFIFSDSVEKRLPSRNELGIANDLQVIPNVDFIPLNDIEMEKLNVQYFNGELHIHDLQNNPSAIIFFPINDAIEEKSPGIITGDIIKLGQLINVNNFDEISYREWDFTVTNVIPSRFSLDINENITKESSRITIVFHESVNKELSIFPGFSEVIVYMHEKVNQKELHDIEIKTKEIVSPIPGSLYQSIPELASEENNNSTVFKVLSSFLFISTVSFSIISIIAVVYGRFLLKQREWGTLRALGITKKQLNLMFFLEITVYVTISNLLVLVLVLALFVTQPLYGEVALYLSYFLYSILLVYCAVIAATIIICRLINKVSISSLIRSTV